MSLNIPLIHEQNQYYLQLDSRLQGIYRTCAESLARGDLNVNLGSEQISEADLAAISGAVDYGCPELFFIDKDVKLASGPLGTVISFTSKYPVRLLSRMWDELDGIVSEIAAELSSEYSDEDIIYKLNEYLCANIEVESSERAEYGDAYGALLDRTARCEGVSNAASMILNRLSIPSIMAIGTATSNGEEINHSWNIIWIGGSPYGFDFTWNIGASSHGIASEVYMFLPRCDMDIQHTPDPAFSYPIVEFSELTPWYKNKTEASCRADLGGMMFRPSGNNYHIVIRLTEMPSFDEVSDDIYDWYMYELGGDTMYGSMSYRYNEELGVLTVYVIVEEF